MACSTRGFGAPVTDAGGNVARTSVAESDVVAQPAPYRAHEVVQTRGAPRPRTAAGTWTDPGSQTRPRSLRARSTIITFSAWSLLLARSAARVAAVPLIGRVSTSRPSHAQEPLG